MLDFQLNKVPVFNYVPRPEDYSGVELYLHPFLNMALDGGGCLVSIRGRFTRRGERL